MRLKSLFFISIIIITLLALLACDSDKPTRPDGVFIVSGSLFCTYCSIIDSLNATIDSSYSIETGRLGTITFESLDSQLTVVKTDSRSRYGLFLKPGIYEVTVETDYTFPDYFHNVEILSDTTLDLTVNYDVSVYDSIYVRFTYIDPLAIPYPYTSVKEAELAYIDSLNKAIGGFLSTDYYETFYYSPSQYNPNWITIYEVALSGKASVAETFTAARTEMTFGGGNHPDNMSISTIRRFGFCPEDWIIIDTFPIPYPFPWDDSGVVE